MDRRTLLAIFLMLAVYYAYLMRTNTLMPEGDSDSLVMVDGEPQPTEPVEPVVAEPVPTPVPTNVPVQTHGFEQCGIRGTTTSDGGVLRDAVLTEHEAPYVTQPIYEWVAGVFTGTNPEGGWKPYGEPPGPQIIGSPRAEYFGMGAGGLQTAPLAATRTVDGDAVIYTTTTAEGLVLTRRLQPRFKQSTDGSDPCVIDLTATFNNPTSTEYTGQVWLGLLDESPLPAGYEHYRHPAWMADGSADSWEGPSSSWYLGIWPELAEPELMPGKPEYFGVTDGYFSVAALVTSPDPKGQIWATLRKVEGQEEGLYGTQYVIAGLAAGASVSETFEVYTGPNSTAELIAVDERLGNLVSTGFLSAIGTPLLWLLHFFHGQFGNWGVAIILLTVTVKGALFPLTNMSFKSSQAMQEIQPELKRVREEYKDSPEELNRKTMELFKENGVNPLGGCLPMILQMPIWLALFRVLQNSVDLYHTDFLYLRDLSAPDPYNVLPVLAIVVMLLQQRMMPMGNMDPTQARMMRLLPLVFGIFFFTFPSGLVVYIFVNMCLTMVQQWWIKRQFGTNKKAQPETAAG